MAAVHSNGSLSQTPWREHGTRLCVPPLDPRTASTQSLVPSCTEKDQKIKRRLLVIYVHGFIGSEDSFHSFPFHVHIQLKEKAADTHVVHSKIYPRYKTYKAFHLARDNFSRWLSAHEDANTDIILVGHSMGGLLIAEVTLMRNESSPYSNIRKHRILGTVHLDAPLLGAQNRVILAGVLSPFRSRTGVVVIPKINASGESFNQHSKAEVSSMNSRSDLDFNQPFANDVRIQDRGWWENVLHFARKHEDEGFVRAGFRHWKAHFEFGSCLLNSHRLKERYNMLRELDGAEQCAGKATASTPHERVRFVQFYTASFKGRAGKRQIRRKYIEEPQKSATTSSIASSISPDGDKNDQEFDSSSYPMEDLDNMEELYFCKLAREPDGNVDALWKRVLVATNDEIDAHTIIFLPGPHYDDLVERVSSDIAGWLSDVRSERV